MTEFADKRWPTKVAKYKYFKDGDVHVVMTEGLSHPFPSYEGPPEGLGCEFFMESTDEDSVEWMTSILRELVDKTIEDPALPLFAKEVPALPVELSQIGVRYPEEYRNHKDRKMCVFVGMSHRRERTITNSEGKELPLLNVRLLKRRDFLVVRLGGMDRVKRIYTKLRKEGNHTQSSLKS